VGVVVEVAGLEIPGRHGVEEWERETEQPFVYDVELEVAEPSADEIGHTVDYRGVVELVGEVSERRQFQLLESLAAAVAEALVERFPAERVRVRVRKPAVQLGAPVEHAAATVERTPRSTGRARR
jgi:7,8-dihydroneopterin aldolase/epimerase/oxygenase